MKINPFARSANARKDERRAKADKLHEQRSQRSTKANFQQYGEAYRDQLAERLDDYQAFLRKKITVHGFDDYQITEEEFAELLSADYGSNASSLECDITVDNQTKSLGDWIKEKQAKTPN
jgi:hypothetical protein